jgi:hypothetical protein
MTKLVHIYLEDAGFRTAGKMGRRARLEQIPGSPSRAPEGDPLLSASGMIDSLPEDLSEHFDRYLQETAPINPAPKPAAR